MAVVTKEFKTVNRRFKVGDKVEPADIVGALTFSDWKARGCIADESLAAPAAKSWLGGTATKDDRKS